MVLVPLPHDPTHDTPREPPKTDWQFPNLDRVDPDGLVGTGADLEPATVLAAYRHGIFPMPIQGRLGWWSPDPRGILPLDELKISRSLRRSAKRFRVSLNENFQTVMTQCQKIPRDGGWITTEFVDTYSKLHEMGWTHSIEVWDEKDDLVGGLYGIRVNGLFAGESMFSLATDASKVALVELVRILKAANVILLDVQWQTPHLSSLGVVEFSRGDYLDLLKNALEQDYVALEGLRPIP